MYNTGEGMEIEVCAQLSNPVAREVSSVPLTVANSVSGYDDTESMRYKN